MTEEKKPDPEPEKKPAEKPPEAPPDRESTSEGTVTVGRTKVPYRAVAGTYTMKEEDGTAKATSVSCTSSTMCTAVAPAHSPAGKVDVKATVNKVSSPKNAPADQYTYS